MVGWFWQMADQLLTRPNGPAQPVPCDVFTVQRVERSASLPDTKSIGRRARCQAASGKQAMQVSVLVPKRHSLWMQSSCGNILTL